MEHSPEARELGWQLVGLANGNVLKAIEIANLLRVPAQEEAGEGRDPDGVRKLDDAISFLRDVREEQLVAGNIFRQARAKRAARR